MKMITPGSARWFLGLAALALCGCGGEYRSLWREQKLPSGRVTKVTSCLLAWGAEHDERTPEADCFALEIVYSAIDLSDAAREREAVEAFELIRPASELWHFKHASVAGFPTLIRKGRYDVYLFEQGTDGRWTNKHYAQKVFVND